MTLFASRLRPSHIAMVALVSAGFVPCEPAQAAPEQRVIPPSIRQLLAVPPSGVAYYQTKEKARELFAQSKWAEAEPLWRELARAYPRDPENWTNLADVLEHRDKFLDAADARRRAGELQGWDLEFPNGYLLAADLARGGKKHEAIETLNWMINERHGYFRAQLYSMPEFAVLKDDPAFLKLIGRVDTTGWSQEKGWLYDADYLYQELKRVNPDFRDKPFPPELEKRYQSLRQMAGTASPAQMLFGMNRMLAALNQGHVSLFMDSTSIVPQRFLPVQFYLFPEGLFIIDADEPHKGLIGAQVHNIGKLPADEALRLLSEVRSVDGDMQYAWGADRLAQTVYLEGMGAIDATEKVLLTVSSPGGSPKKVTVETLRKPREGRQDKLKPVQGVKPPLFLSNMSKTFWEAPLPGRNAHYVQINNLLDSDTETLEQFGNRLWTVLQSTNPENLIIDLRHNNGGTTQLYPALLRTLTAYSRLKGRQIYVLIGRRTFSAAGNFVTDAERLISPIFVGEATSECCNLYGDPTSIVLPFSQIKGELTNVKWMLSTPSDRRREISPEVPVQLSAKAHFSGSDPVLDAALQLIAQRR